MMIAFSRQQRVVCTSIRKELAVALCLSANDEFIVSREDNQMSRFYCECQ